MPQPPPPIPLHATAEWVVPVMALRIGNSWSDAITEHVELPEVGVPLIA